MLVSRRRAVAIVVAAAVVAFIIVAAKHVRFDPDWIDGNWGGTPLPPCFLDAAKCYGHVLGTDEVGRDILARLMSGGEVSLMVALIAVAVEVILGICIAISARRNGPIVSFVVLRFEAALSCLPPWPFMLTMIAIGTQQHYPTLSLFVLAALAGLVFAPRIARVAGSTRELRGSLPALLDRAAYDLTRLIALLATIDIFGLGAQPPTTSWGSMLHFWQDNISIAWWAVIFPAVSIISAVLVIEILRRLLFDRAPRAASDVEPHTIASRC
jgi:ABC-type dipeptide/oligopeptide/nickel transport system permease subunit